MFAHQPMRGGLAAKAAVVPRDTSGAPSPTGLIGMIGIGMSNAGIIQNRFQQILFVTNKGDANRHPAFRYPLVTYQNGKTAESWSVATNPVWAMAQTRVAQVGLSALQIQVGHVIIDAEVSTDAPHSAMTAVQVQAIVANLVLQFPNIKLVWLSGLNYTGYSDDPLLSLSDRERVPEPYAHDDSLLMESLVELGGFPVWTDFVDLWLMA